MITGDDMGATVAVAVAVAAAVTVTVAVAIAIDMSPATTFDNTTSHLHAGCCFLMSVNSSFFVSI